jgi:uncharacterized protein YbjT (DUF2867 family)
MGLADKIAIIGHNGWAASHIIKALAAQPFHQRLRVLARHGSSTAQLPPEVEVRRYAWEEPAALESALDRVDILMYVPLDGRQCCRAYTNSRVSARSLVLRALMTRRNS